jgi:nitric oxide reductase large subunit
MWWITAVVVLIVLLAVASWRQRGRTKDRFMTQQDIDRHNVKGQHGGFTGYGGSV